MVLGPVNDGRVMRHTLLSRVKARIATPADACLAARMLLWACCLPVLKHVVQLRALVRLVRKAGYAGTRAPIREEQIITLGRWSARLTKSSSRGNCLERALLLYRFLGAANAQPSLVVGFGWSPHGEVRGHAWVVVDGCPVGESSASLAEFESALVFGPDGRPFEQSAAFTHMMPRLCAVQPGADRRARLSEPA